MWDLLLAGSEEQADELGLVNDHDDDDDDCFGPETLATVDQWLAAQEGPLGEEEAARLGFFLSRVLIETHGGGLTRIAAKGHPLDEEWAITGFVQGLPEDYHVPFLISAARIGVDRALSAQEWYRQLLAEASSV